MKLIKAWTPVIVWMVIIFYLSHQPAQQSSELSSGITTVIVNIFQLLIPFVQINLDFFQFIIRKLAHLIAYLILGFLVVRALNKNLKITFRTLSLALFICILYAISDEIHQLFIPGRSGEVRDVIIDTIGAIFGIVLFVLRLQFMKRE